MPPCDLRQRWVRYWCGWGSGRTRLRFRATGGARSDKLLYQAKLALDEDLRLKVVRKMFELRFGEPAPSRRSVDQLRGIEGAVCGQPMHYLLNSMA